jgi:hypothetical protein
MDGRNKEKNPLPALTNANRVGIWERTIERGKSHFVRREDKFKDWHLWADVERIEPKGPKWRVVLIGESAARGMLYDPVFTPAMALETILQSQFGKDEIEVIDLARTNIGYEVKELALSALLLDPDLVIIFAGNNWGLTFPDPSELIQMDAVLRDQGIAGVKRLAEQQLERNARSIVSDIAAIYESRKTPLVWIIPEFNLGDWREPATNAPYLTNGLQREWVAIYEEAQRALRIGEFSQASELAKKMIEIDGGVCAAGFYILAECGRRRGDSETTRGCLELARDALIWDTSRLLVPRSYSVVQEALRSEAGRCKNQAVDLPGLFKDRLKGGIPGRRLFLDYCHLTSEGIQIAMAAAASCVLRSLKGIEIPWDALVTESISPTREIEAEASFLAAIHNAHWSQGYELVHDYCLRALHLSAHIVEIMINYIDLQARRTPPTLMCRSAEKIAELGSPLMSRYLFPRNRQLFDRILLEAIVDGLKTVGIDASQQLDQIRHDEHSAASRDIDLLDYYYCSSAGQSQEVEWARPVPEDDVSLKEAHYYKAYWPYSKFVFFGEAGCPLQLGLTCRLPKLAPTEGVIVVEINGKRQAQLVIDRTWGTWDIAVDEENVRAGVNEIIIRWPFHESASGKGLECAMEYVFRGKNPDFFHVFGEIHSFVASNQNRLPSQSPCRDAGK